MMEDEKKVDSDEFFNSETESDCSSSSCSIEDAEWIKFIEDDGSLMYVESYVSSTLKERQTIYSSKNNDGEKRGLFPLPSKNLKRQTKLLNLLRRRPSIRSSSRSSALSETNSGIDSSAPKVTFRDIPSGDVRHITLNVSNVGPNYGRRATLCESVLKIMPGRFSEPPDSRIMVAGLAPGSQVLREGLVKIGDWLKEINGIEVNWSNLDNILMSVKVPSVVTIAVQKCAQETLSPDLSLNSMKRITQTKLAKFVTGKDQRKFEWEGLVEKGSIPLHQILYLNLNDVTETSPENSDIKYRFPHFENKLTKVRGIFLTVCPTLYEVLNESVKSATVTLHGVHYHCAFHPEEKRLFMLILPHFVLCEEDVVCYFEQICKLIQFSYGSFLDAFSNESNKSELDHLFLLLLRRVVLLEEDADLWSRGIETPTPRSQIGPMAPLSPVFSSGSEYALLRSGIMFGQPKILLLNDEFAKMQLEMILNELESADFGNENSECEDCILDYNIIGCCLFYKTHLILSHLPDAWTELVTFYLEAHALLELLKKEPLCQMVVWKRVFLPSEFEEKSLNSNFNTQKNPNVNMNSHKNQNSNFIPKKPDETSAKSQSENCQEIHHYLLVVAMNHMIICTILESGNVTKLMPTDYGADPFLVDQIETSLYHIHSLHIHSICEQTYLCNPYETVNLAGKSPAKTAQNKMNSRATSFSDGLQNANVDVPSILKQKSTSFPSVADPNCECELIQGSRAPNLPLDDSLSDEMRYVESPCRDNVHSKNNHRDNFGPRTGVELSGTAVDLPKIRENFSRENLESSRESSSGGSDLHIPKYSEFKAANPNFKVEFLETDKPTPLRVTAGNECVLLHLIHLEYGTGMVVTTDESFADSRNRESLNQECRNLEWEFLRAFYSTCAYIRRVLNAGKRNNNGNVSYCEKSNPVNTAKEFGLLMECSTEKNKKNVSYWVVGRLFGAPYEREMYAAFKDSIGQNMQEVAFNVAFGMS